MTIELAEQVRAVVRDVLGRDALTVERQVYGHGSATFAVRTVDDTVYVRTSPHPDTYRDTAANLRGLAALGLPVPRVLAADLDGRRYPFAYLVTDAFAGRDLGFEIASMSPHQASTLAATVVEAERQVGRLPLGTGFGFGPLGRGGPTPDWADAIRADQPALEAGTPLASRILGVLEAARARLGDTLATCFLDDLTTKNVIVLHGELTGFVDFDVVCFGDPMYWLALTQVAMIHDVGDAADFYVQELQRFWDPSARESADLALYSAVHAGAFLDRDDSDRAAADRLRHGIDRWLVEAQT